MSKVNMYVNRQEKKVRENILGQVRRELEMKKTEKSTKLSTQKFIVLESCGYHDIQK